MPPAKKDTNQQELVSVLQTASNRLVYLTPSDWTLIVDRAKRTPFRRGDVLLQQGKQVKMVYLLVHGTQGRVFEGGDRAHWSGAGLRRNGVPGKRRG
jgi:hypothetical protein